MKLDRAELLRALTGVKPGLAKNDIIEQATHFIFDDTVIRTYNDEIAITQPFKSGLKGAVSNKEFFGLFNKIPDEMIEATQKEDDKFHFKGKNKEITFKVEPHLAIPDITPAGVNSKKWMKLPKDFAYCVKFCHFSASKNMTLLPLTGVLVNEEAAVSCDNWRATRMQFAEPIDKQFLMPSDVAIPLSDHNPSKFYTDTNWIHFVNKEKGFLSCRKMDEKEYPEEIVDIFDVKGKKVEFPAGLDEALDRAQQLLAEILNYDKSVDVTFKKDKIICEGRGPVGEIKETIKAKYKGKEMKISIQPSLLIEIIKHLTKAVANEKSLLFEGENFQHVVWLSS